MVDEDLFKWSWQGWHCLSAQEGQRSSWCPVPEPTAIRWASGRQRVAGDSRGGYRTVVEIPSLLESEPFSVRSSDFSTHQRKILRWTPSLSTWRTKSYLTMRSFPNRLCSVRLSSALTTQSWITWPQNQLPAQRAVRYAPSTNNTAQTYCSLIVCVCTCSLGHWKSSLQAKSFPS